MQFGIEIDVAAFDELVAPGERPGGGWTPPAPSATIPLAIVTDLVEVSIFADEGGPVLAGAIELVSPANKDRPAHRDAFTSKCAAYLQAGVGLVVVDVVTNRGGDLHAELMARLFAPGTRSMGDLYSAAYRPVGRDGEVRLDIWREPIALGGPLPVLPLWLKGGPCLPVDLEATYGRTRRELRMVDESLDRSIVEDRGHGDAEAGQIGVGREFLRGVERLRRAGPAGGPSRSGSRGRPPRRRPRRRDRARSSRRCPRACRTGRGSRRPGGGPS